jgi:hypothetical protein
MIKSLELNAFCLYKPKTQYRSYRASELPTINFNKFVISNSYLLSLFPFAFRAAVLAVDF